MKNAYFEELLGTCTVYIFPVLDLMVGLGVRGAEPIAVTQNA
jgi:hypothetical protein